MKALLIASVLAIGACRAGPTNAAMTTLTQQLQEAFPEEIAAISFENAPPLDPPTIFVDMKPGISTDAELTWLCVSVQPLVDAVDRRIEVTTSFGYYLRTDCHTQ